MNKLVETYYKLVKAGKLALGDVPEKYRAAVEELLGREEAN